jgi:isoleucyl-tRNA synthetase
MAEALAKEVVRRAQIMRKEMGLNIEDLVDAEIGFENRESLELASSTADYLKREVRIRSLKLGGLNEVSMPETAGMVKEWNVDGEKIRIALRKI